MWQTIRDHIRDATGSDPGEDPHSVSGGCIHNACRLGDFFVKTNSADFLPMFEAEAEGLRDIAATKTIRVPEPIAWGEGQSSAYLVLEWLDLGHRGDGATMGEQLAALHRHTSPTHGWHRDNTIGSTPQPNPPTNDGIDFLRQHRLGHMFRLLHECGVRFNNADRLLDRLDEFFPGGSPPASLIHGDLWGGNASFLGDGTPVIFDPATHYADREADLAMSELFGGFGPRFYDAYRNSWPLDDGHSPRCTLYQLYHVLNHALLFGGGYASQARSMIASLIAS